MLPLGMFIHVYNAGLFPGTIWWIFTKFDLEMKYSWFLTGSNVLARSTKACESISLLQTRNLKHTVLFCSISNKFLFKRALLCL